MPKKIVVSGYYGFGNTGDEAVLSGMLATFGEVGLEAKVTVLSADPERTMAEHPGVEAVHRYSIRHLIKVIRAADLVISGGGSLLQDVTSTRSVRYYLFILQMAQFFKRKTMIYAQGVGPLRTQSMRRAVAKILNRVNVITVRDTESRQLLEEIGVKKPQVHLSADPAFVIQANTADAERIIAERNAGKGALIGVSLRPWPGYENQIAELVEGVEEACKELGIRAALIPMQEPEDCGVCEEFPGGIMLRGSGKPDVVKGIISRCGLIVGMRLHALILAASEGVPFIAVSYDPKVSSFALSLGHSDMMEIDNVSSESVKNAVLSTWKSRASVTADFSERALELRSLAKSSGEFAKELIG